jgi:hypothetical protein
VGRTMVLDFEAGHVVGQTVLRLTNQLQQTSKVRIVLKMQIYNSMPYYILNAFPTL